MYVVTVSARACVWRSEDKFWKSALSFYRVGPSNQTQVVRLGGKTLLPAESSPQLKPNSFKFYNQKMNTSIQSYHMESKKL